MTKTKVPVSGIESEYQRVTVCFSCGYFYEGNFRDTCQNCGAEIKPNTYGNLAKLNRVLPMETAIARRREQITCNEEERLKYGYNIITHFRYASQKRKSAIVQAANGTPLFNLKLLCIHSANCINHVKGELMLDFNRSNRVIDKDMGEVRVQVKLTNAIDEELVNRGLLNPNQLRVYETQALVDTGAIRTVLPIYIVQQLGLRIRGQQLARYADGREEAVGLTGPVIIELQGRETTEAALVAGDEVLIGQTVLETLDFHVDCKNQRLIPNPAHPDHSVLRI